MSGRVLVQSGELRLQERLFRYRLRRTPRRRHVHLLVTDDGVVEVRAPWRFSAAAAEAAIRANAGWLLRALHGAAQRREARPALVSGCVLPLLDESLELRVRDDVDPAQTPAMPQRRRARIWRQACRLHVWLHGTDSTDVETLLEGWYRQQAREQLGSRLRALAPALGVMPSAVSIRAQRTRWGSCSSRGVISLNWRLLLLPTRLADYVLVHELCHLRHMDHSPAFWALVASQIADHDERRAELRERQGRLPL